MVEYKPVVVGKPKRALSIEEVKVAGETETFFKAYSESNTSVLVPESSLEAMRNLVNLNIRRRGDSLFSRSPHMKSEKQHLKTYLDKLEHLALKLDEFEKNEVEEYELDESDSGSEVLESFDKIGERTPSEGCVKRESHCISRTSSVAMSQQLSDEETEENIKIGPLNNTGEDLESKSFRWEHNNRFQARSIAMNNIDKPEYKIKRVLIHGYVKRDKQPVFMIQPYKGEPVLQRTKPLQCKEISDDGIQISVCGEFYSQNILEERDNIPMSLTIGNRQIVIDESSIIFEDGVADVLSTEEIHIALRGTFIKRTAAPFYTPSLCISVRRKCSSKIKRYYEKSMKTNYTLFGDKLANHSNLTAYTINSRGFELSHTHKEGRVTIYETNPIQKPKKLSSAGEFSKYDEVGIYENYPSSPRATKGLKIIASKTVFGDVDTTDDHQCRIYECGSANDLAMKLSVNQSKTEYSNIGSNPIKSTHKVANHEKVKHGKLKNIKKYE